jgi:hypothetical protein
MTDYLTLNHPPGGNPKPQSTGVAKVNRFD